MMPTVNANDRPRLRNVDAFPVEAEGKKMICLRDPEGYLEEALIVSPAAMFILSLCDGTRSLPDIQAEYARAFGQLLFSEELDKLLERVEHHHLLEGESFERYREEVERAYLDRESRPSAFAGKAFPGTAPELQAHLDEMLSRADTEDGRGETMRGAIAPHIDFVRGEQAYASIYHRIRQEVDASLFVILGVVHAGTDRIYTATEKHFETPLGRLRTDRETLEALVKRYPGDLFEDEVAHRGEHSIEFQAVFLQHLFGDRNIRILPILCGSFQPFVLGDRSPMDDPVVEDFVLALREVTASSGRSVFFLAGADLSHVGLRFGDAEVPTPDSVRRLEEEDRRTLDFAARGDGEGFYRSIQRDGDRRKVCGISAIYTLIHTLRSDRGELIHYGQSPDPALPSVVTFGSLAYY
jgi:AmmeMemoRadiSam system protein B